MQIHFTWLSDLSFLHFLYYHMSRYKANLCIVGIFGYPHGPLVPATVHAKAGSKVQHMVEFKSWPRTIPLYVGIRLYPCHKSWFWNGHALFCVHCFPSIIGSVPIYSDAFPPHTHTHVEHLYPEFVSLDADANVQSNPFMIDSMYPSFLPASRNSGPLWSRQPWVDRDVPAITY